MESISSVSRSVQVSSWSKARGLEPTEKASDVDEDELIELLELEELDEQTIEVSDDENKPNPPK